MNSTLDRAVAAPPPGDLDRPWTPVCPPSKLPPGELRVVDVGGREGVVWRGASGRLGAVEAWCPHLGAHLGEGGRIDGEALVCAFHHWKFDPQGICAELGYPAPSIPPQARAQTWEIAEHDGRIWLRPPVEPPLPKRGVGEVPSVPGRHPEGWYKVALSRDLADGGRLAVRYFGRDLTVARDPELRVRMHDREGSDLPGRELPVCETGGLVLAWYGVGEPSFEPPDFDRFADPRRSWRHYDETVASSVWDVAENPFDVAHLRTVHHLLVDGDPEVVPDGPHLHLSFEAGTVIDGVPLGLTRHVRTRTHVQAYGIGLTLAHIEPQQFAQTWILGCNTPVDDDQTEYTLVFVSQPNTPLQLPARAFHRLTAALVWRLTRVERLVWGRKQYLKKPCLTRPEKGIARFRKWARQFACV